LSAVNYEFTEKIFQNKIRYHSDYQNHKIVTAKSLALKLPLKTMKALEKFLGF
jgi:hypothetical protein